MTVVSALAALYLYRIWKKRKYVVHFEFSMFFLVLAISFFTYTLAPFSFYFSRILELHLFLVLLSFSFVLRAFVRFQNISFISLNFISVVVVLLSGIKLFVGILDSPTPLIQDVMVYHYYSPVSSLVFGILIVAFTILMAMTLLSNLQNIKRNRTPVLFLGTAFFTGGIGGALVTNFNVFGLLLLGNILLFLTFVLVSLFIFSSSRKEGRE